jgi:hypothetical protein
MVQVVVPTVGRPSLLRTLAPLLGQVPVVVVDDRRGPDAPLDLPGVQVLTSGGRGPAAARNVGWRAATADWIAFLDDDVVPPPQWAAALRRDLARCGPEVGASAGRIVVPLPPGRAPTDWERSTAGLETAVWATADLAYRRAALAGIGGFDERFPRAYREDADLGLRVSQAGWRMTTGERYVEHPVRPASPWISVRAQRGNADDVLLRALHGPGWRALAHVPPGRRRWHLATTAMLATTGLAAVAGRHRPAALSLLVWTGLTADFARRRIAPGPRTAREVALMVATSTAIPPAATRWWLTGLLARRRTLRRPGPVRERREALRSVG